jgi:hypothetical protein
MPFPHWQFFESLDEELISLSRIIDFTKENLGTHSVHLARMYLSICSEIDVVSKLLCSRIAPTEKPSSMDEYRHLVTNFYPKLHEVGVTMPFHDIAFQPWLEWASNTNPWWWTAHNKVKHERNKYFQEANLRNVLFAASGLLVILAYYHQPELSAQPSPLFSRRFKSMIFVHPYYEHYTQEMIRYNLPDFNKKPST